MRRGVDWDVGKEWGRGQKGRACENGGVGKERGIGREMAGIEVEKSQSGGTGVWEHMGP
jgi:hypothetical protein